MARGKAAAKPAEEPVVDGQPAAPEAPVETERPEPTAEEWERRRAALLAKVPPKDQRPTNIYAMLAQILGIIGAVEKRGYNAFHKYRFVKEADLVEAVRPLLAEYGIFVMWTIIAHERRTQVIKDRDKNITGESESLTVVTGDYWFVHGESEQKTDPQHMMGYGDDPGDKGLYKALTGMEKYFLMKTFMVSTGDDPESDDAMDRRSASREASSRVDVRRGGGGQGQRQPAPGGRQTDTSKPQAQIIGELIRAAGIRKTEDAAALISRLSGKAVPEGEDRNAALKALLDGLEPNERGKLVHDLRKHVESLPQGGEGQEVAADETEATEQADVSNPAAPAGAAPDESLEAGPAV